MIRLKFTASNSQLSQSSFVVVGKLVSVLLHHLQQSPPLIFITAPLNEVTDKRNPSLSNVIRHRQVQATVPVLPLVTELVPQTDWCLHPLLGGFQIQDVKDQPGLFGKKRTEL